MAQKTITGTEAVELASLGIECFVKCTSNKVDEAKDDIRSVNLNFDIKAEVEGELKMVGKGNNLNINNITPEHYRALCGAFGVESIDTETPFVAVLYTASEHAKVQEWIKAMARAEKNIDDSQTDVTDPNTATKKQGKYIDDLIEKKAGSKDAVTHFLGDNEVADDGTLDRDQASELIDILKELPDAEENEYPSHDPKDCEDCKLRNEKMCELDEPIPIKDVSFCSSKVKGSPEAPSKENTFEEGGLLVADTEFPTRMAGGLEKNIVVEHNKKDDFLFAHAIFNKEPTATQLKSIPKKLKEITGLDWDYVGDRLFNASNGQLNPESISATPGGN